VGETGDSRGRVLEGEGVLAMKLSIQKAITSSRLSGALFFSRRAAKSGLPLSASLGIQRSAEYRAGLLWNAFHEAASQAAREVMARHYKPKATVN
jgi:hypothetical protein